jgi:hypothetical protein
MGQPARTLALARRTSRMSNYEAYSKVVRNFTGGSELTLEVVERDGGIGIGLASSDDRRMSFLDVTEAEAVINGIRDAIKRARAKPQRT